MSGGIGLGGGRFTHNSKAATFKASIRAVSDRPIVRASPRRIMHVSAQRLSRLPPLHTSAIDTLAIGGTA